MFVQIPLSDNAEQNVLLVRHLTAAVESAQNGRPVLGSDGPTWFELYTALGYVNSGVTMAYLHGFIQAMLAARYPVIGEPLPVPPVLGRPSAVEVYGWTQSIGWSDFTLDQAERLINMVGTQRPAGNSQENVVEGQPTESGE